MVTATNLNPDPQPSPSGHIAYHKVIHVAVDEVTAFLDGLADFPTAVREVVSGSTFSADILTDGTVNRAYSAADEARVEFVASSVGSGNGGFTGDIYGGDENDLGPV